MPSCCDVRVDFQRGDGKAAKQELSAVCLHVSLEKTSIPRMQEQLLLRSEAQGCAAELAPPCHNTLCRLCKAGVNGQNPVNLCQLPDRQPWLPPLFSGVGSHDPQAGWFLSSVPPNHDLSHRKALNSDPEHDRNMNIPLQTLSYLFLEQKSGRIHQWSNETLNTLGPAKCEKDTQITGPLEITAVPLYHYAPNIPASRGRSERISKASHSPLDPEVSQPVQPQRLKKQQTKPWLCSERTASASSSSALPCPARSS